MRKLFSVILALTMILALAACGQGDNSQNTPAQNEPTQNTANTGDDTTTSTGDDAPADGKLKVAVSLMNIDAFMSYVAEGAESYGKDNPDVEVTVYDAKSDANAQLTTIENALIQGVDAIVITPVDTDATAPITALCEEYGVPLIATNARCSTATTSFVGSDNVTSGEQEGQFIADLLGGEGKIVILAGVLASQNGRDRLTGAHNIVDAYDGIEVLAEQSANWSRSEAMEITENWLQSDMEIDAIIAGNDEMAIGAALACQEFGVDLPIVGVGGTEDGLNAVLNGQIRATILWNGFEQGRVGVDAAVRAARGETLPEYIDVETALVTADNAAEYLKLFE